MGRCKKCGGTMVAVWRVGSFDDEPETCFTCGETADGARAPTPEESAAAEELLTELAGRSFVGDRSVYARRRGAQR